MDRVSFTHLVHCLLMFLLRSKLMSFIAPGVKFFCPFICSRVTYQPAKSIASIRGQSTVHMCHWEKAGKQGVKEARSREESEGGKGGGVK